MGALLPRRLRPMCFPALLLVRQMEDGDGDADASHLAPRVSFRSRAAAHLPRERRHPAPLAAKGAPARRRSRDPLSLSHERCAHVDGPPHTAGLSAAISNPMLTGEGGRSDVA